MYFNSPPASRNNAPSSGRGAAAVTPSRAPVSAPKSNGGSTNQGVDVVQLQDDEGEDDDDEEEEEDLMDQVAAYQQQLRSQGAPAMELQEQDEDDSALETEVCEPGCFFFSVALAFPGAHI